MSHGFLLTYTLFSLLVSASAFRLIPEIVSVLSTTKQPHMFTVSDEIGNCLGGETSPSAR